MLRSDGLAIRILRWFVDHPGLHNAATLEELEAAIGEQSHTYGQRITDLRRNGVTIVCDLMYRDGVTTAEARAARMKHADKPRYRHYLPMSALPEAKSILSAAAPADLKNSGKAPSDTAAPGVPPPASGAHPVMIPRCPYENEMEDPCIHPQGAGHDGPHKMPTRSIHTIYNTQPVAHPTPHEHDDDCGCWS